jgi:uncharacterized protein (TIGR03118 family)
MKSKVLSKTGYLKSMTVVVAALSVITFACKKSNNSSPATYVQTNLVADTAGYGAARIDTNLNNPWGIAIGPTGVFWISANHSGSTVVYDGSGAQVLAEVNIPFNGNANGASPSGVIYNTTSNFIIPSNGLPAKFIYVTEDGIVSAWNTGDSTILVADRSAANAVYKGIALANDGTGNFIYVADIHNAKVDVFDQSFHYVTNKPFTDPGIPAGFAPFNIQNIGGQLYVTYAKQKAPDNKDDQKGTGNGYVDIYKPDGTLVKRFASQGTLNSPWGVAQAPAGFGQVNNAILIGNFGDGRINVFDANGNYQGQLMNSTAPISIDGLWAITFPQSTAGSLNVNALYFTAAPQEEIYGIFGYIKKQ